MIAISRIVLVLAFVLPGAALAQTEPPVDLDNPGAAPSAPGAAPQTTATAPAKGDDDDGTDDGVRPGATSIGIGVGYTLPADVMAPNTASVRFRFASGLQLEPRLELSTGRSSTDFMGAETDDESATTEASANVRYPLGVRGPVDVLILGGAGVGYSKNSPDGDDNDTTGVAFRLNWGLGLDYWITQRWALSASALNPLLSIDYQRTEQTGGSLKQTTFNVGAIFEPSFLVMAHLYF